MLEKQMVEMLNKLAAKLGVASAKIWEWSLLQVKVEMVQSIVLVLLTLVVGYGFYKWLRYVVTEWDNLYRKDLEFISCLGLTVYGVILLIMVVGSAVNLYELPQLIINPEYSAFQNIIQQLSVLK